MKLYRLFKRVTATELGQYQNAE